MFENEKPPAKDVLISLRVTTEQNAALVRIAENLGLSGKAEVLRTALHYWLTNDAAAKRAARA